MNAVKTVKPFIFRHTYIVCSQKYVFHTHIKMSDMTSNKGCRTSASPL